MDNGQKGWTYRTGLTYQMKEINWEIAGGPVIVPAAPLMKPTCLWEI